MEFAIASDVSSRFPGTHIGVIEGDCAENAFVDEAFFEREVEKIVQSAVQVQPLSEHPNIASWRRVFKQFGADPTKTRSSAEALMRRLQKGDSFPRINAIVDVYNSMSVKHVIPVGGQDALKIVGSIVLRFATPKESFTPLGATQPQSVDVGEVVYADAQKVLCSKWNYRDCEPAKISVETKKFILFVDGAPGIPKEDVQTAANELSEALAQMVQGCTAHARLIA